jgi:hypothetical protein
MNRAEEILQRYRYTRYAMVLEHWEVDDHIARFGQGAADQTTHRIKGHQSWLESQEVIPKATISPSLFGNRETASLEISIQPVPDNDVAGFHTDLLKPLADDLHQLDSCRDPFTGQAIHLESDDLPWLYNSAPGLDWIVAIAK